MKQINGTDLKKMLQSAAGNLQNNRQTLNDLNVFPVPDGDTGTNMSLTLLGAASALDALEDSSLTLVADKISSALLRAARGNSGVILSLLFRGLAKGLKGMEQADAAALAGALSEGVDAAYKAVLKPAEGTILTVSKVAARCALAAAADGEAEIDALITKAIEAAQEALALTPTQNPVLAKAGVVDAGGMGWIMILEGMLAALLGGEIAVRLQEPPSEGEGKAPAGGAAEITFGYCTEFLIVLGAKRRAASRLLSFLNAQGDSVVMVEDEEIIKVHIHTNHPGLVLEEAVKYGNLDKVKIDNMRLQNAELAGNAADAAGEIAPAERPFGFVTVSAGDGIAEVFTDLGADQIVTGGQTMNPSTEDILQAVNRVPAQTVFVLPNNKNIILAAEQTVGLTEKTVIVLPTKSIPQGITALLAFDPNATAQQNADAMGEALTQVKTGQVTFAARDSDFDGTHICKGEFLSLFESRLCQNSAQLSAVLHALLTAMDIGEASFITVFTGEDVTEAEENVLTELLQQMAPETAEITTMRGGQPIYYFIISVE